MIRYTLKCENGHQAESWFRDSATYEAQAAAGRLACAVCGSAEVGKALMAPAVPGRAAPTAGPAPARAEAPAEATLHPRTPAEKALAALRSHIERTTDYVGPAFAAEARRIHEGEVDHRPIWGEASLEEAKALHQDGVPVMPLPWMSRRDD